MAKVVDTEHSYTFDEADFQRWYAAQAQRLGLNPNPDDPAQQYNYRQAYLRDAKPPAKRGGHWPSDYKFGGHGHIIVGGFHTQTGERVPGTPRAKNAAELVRLGWDPETAVRLMALPEPRSESLTYLADLVRRTQRDERRQP